MKLKEIAGRIDVHLRRMEADRGYNFYNEEGYGARQRLYNAGAYSGGRFCYVQYKSYQGSSPLIKSVAESYLAWLDAGHKGTHWDSLRAETKQEVAV